MSKSCLVVIYNHNFEKNIDKIKKLYSSRFSKVVQVIPFYRGKDPEVIGVYDAAWQFNGYINQAYERIAGIEGNYDNYLIIADDIVLNPELNENNLAEKLQLPSDAAYIMEAKLIDEDMMYSLDWSFYSYSRMLAPGTSCEFQRFIPSLEEARACCTRHGYDWKQAAPDSVIRSYLVQKKASHEFLGEMLPSDGRGMQAFMRKHAVLALTMLESGIKKMIRRNNFSDTDFHSILRRYAKWFAKSKKKAEPLYPLFWGYSDVMVIPRSALRDFAHLCGVFSAMRVFVEVALPTALVFCAKRLRTDRDIPYHGVPMWGRGRLTELAKQHDHSIAHLLSHWPQDVFFYHPIKLSQWNLDI